MVVVSTDPMEARRIARAGMKIYLGLPNYANNLRLFGFNDDDIADGGSDRLVDAIVAWGTPDQIAARVALHHDAGADHVCIQVLNDDRKAAPAREWTQLAEALL
jgi:probable F420-dependent oxidoreductase